jgi:hypothetical protein
MNNMAKQMEMFDEGGLMDEGGTVDPVSGNDVPPGSTQEEVRDDIPAQLSEGEFVFPADVVRFIGLEKLMKIRQRAKAGLQRMEDMGQMGNSEEAIMPDTLPFSIEDLDMEDEDEYNTPQEFNQGGMPDPNAGVYYNPALQPTTGVAPAPVTAASSNIARSIPIAQAATPMQAGSSNQPAMFNNYPLPQAPVPTMPQRDDLPPFLGGVVPGVGSGIDFDEETYVNDAGQPITFRRYKDGSLKDMQGNVAVIPEGYKLKSEADKDVGTGPVKVESATVQEDDRGERSEQDQEDMERNQARVDAAKALGYTDFAGIGQGLAAALGFATLPAGTVTGIGYVSDGIGNLVDPVTGFAVPAGLIDSVKNSVGTLIATGKNVIAGRGLTDPFTQKTIAKGFGAKSKGVRDIQAKVARSKVSEKFASIRQDIKDDKYGVDFKDFKDNYVNDVEESIAKEVANGNIDFETGLTINPAEASRRATKDAKSNTPSAPAPSEAASREAANKEQAARQQAARDERDRSDRDDGVGERDGGGYGSDAGTGGGGDMGVICLTEDMKVNRNGVIDFVTNVKVGDIVDNTVVTEVRHKHMREGYYVVNGELKITNDHPVLANGSWKRTENLVLGDYINNVEVTSLEYIEQVTPTVYIGTADDRYDVYTEGEVYTVHGQYKNALEKAA